MSLKNHLALLLVCSILAFNTACQNETLVTKIDTLHPNTQRTDGVIFSLPETVVVAEIPVSKVASSPGLYASWTPFFYTELSEDEYVTAASTVFKVGTPTFTTRGQTDPENIYMAHIKAKAFETKTLLLEFNDDGIIARTETSSKDESIDIITAGLKTVATIAAPLLHGGAAGDSSDTNGVTETRKVDCANQETALQNAKDELNTAMARAARRGLLKDQAAATKAQQKVDEAIAERDYCHEEYFKDQLSLATLSLYDSLGDDYRKFLRENFGYDFLTFVAKKDRSESAFKSANITFFLTLNESQQKFITSLPHGNAACAWSTTGKCLSQSIKIDLLRAKTIFDKIQDLRQKREELALKDTQAGVNTSSNLELKLKEIDSQIKGMELTYFLGTSSETSSAAKVEFKPDPRDGTVVGDQTKMVFEYSAGGSNPGICTTPTPETPVLKIVWPKKLKGDCHTTGQAFEAKDFKNLKQLKAKLAAVAPPAVPLDPVAFYVYNQLLPATKVLIGAAAETPQTRDALRTKLATDLSAIVGGASIYNAVRFQDVKLSGATLTLLNTVPLPPADVPKLNRLLLEDAFSDEFYRLAAWSATTVSITVNDPPQGIATTVRGAQLQEPGKRGFPYRIAAITNARLFDGENEKGRSAVRVAQFGPVQTLPANLGGRRSSYKITYYDASGAIKIFDMSADALIQKQNITDLTDAATTLRDSEAARLKRETELINAKKDKILAEKALKEAQATPSPTATPSPE